MKKIKQQPSIHTPIRYRIRKHIHKIVHVTNFLHHQIFHSRELIIVCMLTLTSLSLANLSWANEALYRDNETEVAEQLLTAMQNPVASLKKGNLISIWSLDMDIENTFAKWYCTYGAARVSPEFFPFVEEKVQQRTWWGNAVDRCENAAATWYKIWNIPVQWSLIVYNAWGRFGNYGHVGKVLHYDKTHKKIIVRDMAWVGRWLMSDRREDVTTANVKCYIYHSKNDTPEKDTPSVDTGAISSWNNTVVTTGTTTNNNHPAAETTTPPTLEETTPWTNNNSSPSDEDSHAEETPIVEQTLITKQLSLRFDEASDIVQHFVSQHTINISLVAWSPLTVGNTASLTMNITDKITGQKYEGILPFSFTVLSTNSALRPALSTIKLINNGSIDIPIVGQASWTATIIITMDEVKIGEFSLDV